MPPQMFTPPRRGVGVSRQRQRAGEGRLQAARIEAPVQPGTLRPETQPRITPPPTARQPQTPRENPKSEKIQTVAAAPDPHGFLHDETEPVRQERTA